MVVWVWIFLFQEARQFTSKSESNIKFKISQITEQEERKLSLSLIYQSIDQ